jgi:hypothetical protein
MCNSRGELLSWLMEIEAHEIADLVAFNVDDLNSLAPSNDKRCPFGSGN